MRILIQTLIYCNDMSSLVLCISIIVASSGPFAFIFFLFGLLFLLLLLLFTFAAGRRRLGVLRKRLFQVLNERFFAGTWMSYYPSLLFVHDVPEGRSSWNKRKKLLNLLSIDQWFGIPDANQANLLESCSKSIVLFYDAKSSFFLTLVDL